MADKDNAYEGKDSDAESVYFDAEESGAPEKSGKSSRTRTLKKAVRRLARKQATAAGKAGFGDVDANNTIFDRQRMRVGRVEGLWDKEFRRDEKTGSVEKMDSALWGLAKYQRYTVKDGKGNEQRGKTESVAIYRKSVEYGDDKSKTITRGNRGGFSFIRYTNNADGSRTFNGIKVGPISYERHKGKDGSSSSKFSFGEKYSYEKGTGKDGSTYTKLKLSKLYSAGQRHDANGKLVGSSRTIMGQIATERLVADDGSTKTHRKFTRHHETTEHRTKDGDLTFSKKMRYGRSSIDRQEPDGSRLQYSTRGARLDGTELAGSRDQIAKDIAAKKVRHLKHIDANGQVIAEYNRPRFGFKSNEFKRGNEIAADITKSKSLTTRREGHSVSQAGQEAAARAAHPGKGSRMPGDWSGVEAVSHNSAMDARKRAVPETKLKLQLDARIRGLEERSRPAVLGR